MPPFSYDRLAELRNLVLSKKSATVPGSIFEIKSFSLKKIARTPKIFFQGRTTIKLFDA